jgi:hypothetical protein
MPFHSFAFLEIVAFDFICVAMFLSENFKCANVTFIMLSWLGVGLMTNPLLVIVNMKLQIWMKKG